MSKKVVVASGYFDPLHYGHVEYLQKSKDLGHKLIVIVKNDDQNALYARPGSPSRPGTPKKEKPFMTCAERVKLVRSLECVDAAVESVDEDGTVCKTLSLLHPDIFANGGDKTKDSIPEAEVCKNLGIELRDADTVKSLLLRRLKML
jgi:cytidyltransferase-like protein